MKKATLAIIISLMAAGLMAGCGSNGGGRYNSGADTAQAGETSSDREKELQAEVDALREEVEALKGSQTDQAQDSGTAGESSSGQSSDTGNASSKQSNKNSADVAISLEEARSIALERVPGASEENISIHLDRDDGWYVYEGEIMYDGMEYEFDIDANSGTVVKWEEERW